MVLLEYNGKRSKCGVENGIRDGDVDRYERHDRFCQEEYCIVVSDFIALRYILDAQKGRCRLIFSLSFKDRF